MSVEYSIGDVVIVDFQNSEYIGRVTNSYIEANTLLVKGIESKEFLGVGNILDQQYLVKKSNLTKVNELEKWLGLFGIENFKNNR